MKPTLSLFTLFFLVLIFGCQNSSKENDVLTSLSDTTSITGLTGDSVKLVKTASINFKVKDVEQGTRAISRLVQKLGGMIFNQSFESVEGERKELKISTDSLLVISTVAPQADITARIPSENLEAFMYSVADLGYFTGSSQLNIDDRSLSYLENALKEKARTAVLSQTAIQKNKPSENIKTIALKDEAIEQQIQNRAIDADVKYSPVNLHLFQNSLVRKEVIANYIIADYQLSFGKRFSNAISDGWQYFQAFVLIMANLWMFILTAIVIYISFRYWKHKGKLSDVTVKP
ncbi:DUF4349 domain-containing protein [Chitinophagaceae bacterium LB-8]|uniref:DUF4349 domain-containing protein n=1 Tax=Paraflavisolibacter caeni TaxID=2982496 RepID=A0A9X2XWL2_9BACT|nr:DUF4349 domain-containing protein [Paraflavisolibacter caeni]MCU7549078.1 DUF4349 domain-containing protein [Paraflavisolibacter caeni]